MTSVPQCHFSSEDYSDKNLGGSDARHQPDPLDRVRGDAADLRRGLRHRRRLRRRRTLLARLRGPPVRHGRPRRGRDRPRQGRHAGRAPGLPGHDVHDRGRRGVRGHDLGSGAGPGDRDRPVLRAPQRPPSGLHGDRRVPRRGRPHRRALGSAGPLRGARSDRGARPDGGLTGGTGPPAGSPAGPIWPDAPERPQWPVGTSDQPVEDGRVEDRRRMAADHAQQRKPYHSPRRAEQAIATRGAVLDAARELFIEQGYAVTTVADIARLARVAVDTVYAAVGRKPALLREVLETAISGSDQAVPAEQRDYVARVRAAKGAREKIETYVAALVEIQPRLAPVYLALRDAAPTAPDSAATWREISERRARNMRAFAADLRATGELRTDLSDDDIADIVWSMNGPEYWTLLVSDRGWSSEQFGNHLTDAWQRLFPAHAP